GYLHAHGILHLDIHPANLIVAEDRTRGSVLIDFGLVRSLAGPQLSTPDGMLAGLPPEMLGKAALTPAADLYLAGRLLLYRLTGDLACDARLPREIPGWGARRTLELERIAAKALQPDPSRRFQSAEEFRWAIEKVLGKRSGRPTGGEPGAVLIDRDGEVRRIDEVLRTASAGRAASWRLAGPA